MQVVGRKKLLFYAYFVKTNHMRTVNILKSLSVILLLALVATACKRELDEAPVLTFDGKANMTIAELCDLHTVGASDAYSEIPDGTVITGVITSSDQAGNCYKYLTIQDETGAIMIKIDDSALYPKYRIGQRVYVKCGDLQIGDYHKNKQLGFWVDGAMTGIATSQEDLYIFRDGVCGDEPEPVVITSAQQIDESMYNCLVKIEGCHFRDGGALNYCDAGTNTSRDIVLQDETTIVLRTSSYADFANTLLPEGTGDIVGILTIYNTTMQLIIRSVEDVHITPPVNAEILYSVDFTTDPLTTQGWTVQGDEGWFYYATGQAFAIQNPSTDDIDSWVVSPAFGNFAGYDNVYVDIEDVKNQSAPNSMTICYSTASTGGNFDVAQWTPCNELTALPAEVTANPNFRIAFHYHDANGANWRISDVKLMGISAR